MKKNCLISGIGAILILSIYGCGGAKNPSVQSKLEQTSNIHESSESSDSSTETAASSVIEASTTTPTPEPVSSDLDTVLSGANNNQWIYIDGIVDNFKKNSTGYSYNIFYQTSDGYDVTIMYPGEKANQITDQKVPAGLKNGDIIKMTQFISEPKAGQSFSDVEKKGEASLDEVYSAYKNSCPVLDYDSVIRQPVGTFNDYLKCRFTGNIIQVVDEGSNYSSPEYLIESGDNIIYCTYGRSAENREMRFIEGDTVTIYGDCQAITTYNTLTGENTVPQIWAYLIDLN